MNTDFTQAIAGPSVVNQLYPSGIFGQVDRHLGKLKTAIEITPRRRQAAKTPFERFVATMVKPIAQPDTRNVVDSLKYRIAGTLAVAHQAQVGNSHRLARFQPEGDSRAVLPA